MKSAFGYSEGTGSPLGRQGADLWAFDQRLAGGRARQCPGPSLDWGTAALCHQPRLVHHTHPKN